MFQNAYSPEVPSDQEMLTSQFSFVEDQISKRYKDNKGLLKWYHMQSARNRHSLDKCPPGPVTNFLAS